MANGPHPKKVAQDRASQPSSWQCLCFLGVPRNCFSELSHLLGLRDLPSPGIKPKNTAVRVLRNETHQIWTLASNPCRGLTARKFWKVKTHMEVSSLLVQWFQRKFTPKVVIGTDVGIWNQNELLWTSQNRNELFWTLRIGTTPLRSQKQLEILCCVLNQMD